MSTKKYEFSKKRRNGTMRKKMKGGISLDPRTWFSSSATSTAQVPAVQQPSKQSWSEWFNSLGKKKETAQGTQAVPAASDAPAAQVAQSAPAISGQPNQAGGKRKNKRSRNSKK